MKLDMKKKLLLLGGSRCLLPVIEKAHALGLYVITCDYLPQVVKKRSRTWPQRNYGIIRVSEEE